MANKHISPENPHPDQILELITQRQPDFFSYEDWLRLNELEISRGEQAGRPRLKYTSVEDMIDAVKKTDEVTNGS